MRNELFTSLINIITAIIIFAIAISVYRDGSPYLALFFIILCIYNIVSAFTYFNKYKNRWKDNANKT